MIRGDIYLHPSLTEAFGTVIVEAASCGLYVVATAVGGVPEVLPPHMTIFAKPEEDGSHPYNAVLTIDLIRATTEAISTLRRKAVNPKLFHQEIRNMYSWHDIASRTEKVYNEIHQRTPLPLIDRLKRYYGCGAWAGKLFCLLVALDFLLLWFLEFCFPRENIDVARDWPKKTIYNGEENGSNGKVKGKGGRGRGGKVGGGGVGRDGGGSRVNVMLKESMMNGIGKNG
jgi:phosphatidylinositol N-acetylglucosaminyltransferase subunit A